MTEQDNDKQKVLLEFYRAKGTKIRKKQYEPDFVVKLPDGKSKKIEVKQNVSGDGKVPVKIIKGFESDIKGDLQKLGIKGWGEFTQKEVDAFKGLLGLPLDILPKPVQVKGLLDSFDNRFLKRSEWSSIQNLTLRDKYFEDKLKWLLNENQITKPTDLFAKFKKSKTIKYVFKNVTTHSEVGRFMLRMGIRPAEVLQYVMERIIQNKKLFNEHRIRINQLLYMGNNDAWSAQIGVAWYHQLKLVDEENEAKERIHWRRRPSKFKLSALFRSKTWKDFQNKHKEFLGHIKHYPQFTQFCKSCKRMYKSYSRKFKIAPRQ